VHESGRADDCIDWTRLNAFSATNASGFLDPCDDRLIVMDAELRIDRRDGLA
jgi:hypothetical protein